MFGYSKKHERPVSPGARAHCCYLFIFTFPRTAAAAFPQAHSVSRYVRYKPVNFHAQNYKIISILPKSEPLLSLNCLLTRFN